MAQAALGGALLTGAALLTVVGIIGAQLTEAVHLMRLPYLPGILFAHPFLFPAIAAATGLALMVGMHRLVRHRLRALLASLASGLIVALGMGTVAVASSRLLLLVVRGLPDALAR
jgi:hypothetical protein